MINREKAFSDAFAIKKENLSRKKAEYNAKITALSEKNAEFNDVCARLQSLGARVAITAISGDKNSLLELQNEMSLLREKKDEILEKEGILKVSFDCELCEDTGYISGKICGCVKQIAKHILMSSAKNEFPIAQSRFEDFDLNYYPNTEEGGVNPRKRMTRIFKICREYALDFNAKTEQNLLFMGGSGLGKTHLSLAIVSEILDKGYDVGYFSAYNLFSAMENEHFSYKNNDTYARAIDADLLVIDDLGSEFVSPYIQSCIYNVINTRLLSKKPTVISTNLTMKEIENRYTPRISSRFMGSYTAVKFEGKDIRQLKLTEAK